MASNHETASGALAIGRLLGWLLQRKDVRFTGCLPSGRLDLHRATSATSFSSAAQDAANILTGSQVPLWAVVRCATKSHCVYDCLAPLTPPCFCLLVSLPHTALRR